MADRASRLDETRMGSLDSSMGHGSLGTSVSCGSPYFPPYAPKEEEGKTLRDYSSWLEDELDRVKKKIKELEERKE